MPRTSSTSLVKMAFEGEGLRIAIADIQPLKLVSESIKKTPKYAQIAASIREVGIIEPPILARDQSDPGKYLLLDGHLRIDVLKDMGQTDVTCLISTDDETFTYNKRVNRGAPSQELLVIRRNHQTGQVSLDPLRWGLIPYWCKDPTGGRKPINATCETVRGLPTFRDAYRRRRCIVPVDGLLRVEGDQGAEGEAALRDCHEGRH